ncbi:MAG: hypothetical protein M5U01_29085 [Ardenticatenaceae bacterium]|nr:hypothetical protein [Ardenticatenaceae bacterium]MCZ7571852.1 hypothetical protein [Ardenticatenaceae bacterium]MCZ7572630.1 hypothetical protein [Ardenticatenaceae bacterium]
MATAQQALTAIHAQANDLSQHRQHWQHEIQRLEAVAQARQRPERPHSQVATARQRLLVCERRMARQPRLIERAQQRVLRQQRQVEARAAIEASLTSRLARFEDENRRNPTPVEAVFRLDAGFGTGENVALLIEMGYDVYTKPYHHQVTTRLRRTVSETTAWTRVGANAEVVAWSNQQMAGCPYPLELALERFYTGATVRYSTLLHSGSAPVIGDLLPWFQFYNGRQLIEAGIKEGKNVFQMHHLKIRSAPGLLIQEYCALFAANFVRWAAHWLATDCRHTPLPAPGSPRLPVKELVQVAAHTSAWVESLPDGYRLTFTDQSAYAGKRLQTATWAFQLPLPLFKSCDVPAFLLV